MVARIGETGLGQSNAAAEIVEGLSGGSILGDSSLALPEETAPVEEQMPSYPEEPAQYYMPSEVRQPQFSSEDAQLAQRQVAPPSVSRTIDESNVMQRVGNAGRQNTTRQEAMPKAPAKPRQIQQQTQQTQQPQPRSMMDIINDDIGVQPVPSQEVDVPSYSGMLPAEDTVRLASGGDSRVSMRQTYDTIANALQDNTYQPTEGGSVLSAQSNSISERTTEVEDEDSIEAVASASQADQIAAKIEDTHESVSGENANETTVDYEPQFRQYDYYDLPTTQFVKTQSATKDVTGAAIQQKSWDGNAFTEKAIASDKVAPCDASVGSDVIKSIVREPGNNLIDKVNEVTGSSFTVEEVLTNDGMRLFADAVNLGNIDIVSVKSPVVGPSDVNARRLRIHFGRGILVHPTQTKLWNLDFDGDGISISFDVHNGVKNAMNYLININGKTMIDTDFFPMSQISDDKNTYVEAFKMLFLKNISGYEGVDITKLASAMYYVSNPSPAPSVDFDDYMNMMWCRVLREMRALSNNFSNPDVAMSGILKNVFDNMKLLQQYDISMHAFMRTDESFDEMNEINAQTEPADGYIHLVINQMAAGILPPNFQDFITGLHQYVGEIEGKNVGFRIGAKYAKVIKASQLTFKGDEESYKLIYRLTLQAGESMFMSGRATIGERVAYMQRVAKRRIEAEVGFPGKYGSIQKFLAAFKEAYNNEMRIIECSDFGGFSCDMDPNYDPDRRTYYIKDDSLAEFVTPLISVYGDYTIESMFPDLTFVEYIDQDEDSRQNRQSEFKDGKFKILESYRHMTLKEFSNNNRIEVPGKMNVYRVVRDKDKNAVRNKDGSIKKEKVTIKFRDAMIRDAYSPNYLLLAIAGKRTAAASKYNLDTLNPLLKNFVKCFERMDSQRLDPNARFDDYADYLASMNEMMSALHLSGPAMFDYFKMSDPASFKNSPWGNLINDAIKACSRTSMDYSFNKFHGIKRVEAHDAVGGIRDAMIYEYRFRRIDDINKTIENLLNSEDLSDIADCNVQTVSTVPRRLNQLQNRLEAEFDALASSSDLWKVLVAEVRDGNNWAFQKLKSLNGKGFEDIFSDAKDDAKDSCRFWSDPNNKDYDSLSDVMRDPKLSKSVKEQVAVDVVRLFTGYNGFKSYEMSYQLELESDPAYTSLNLLAYNEQPSVISEIHEANNMLNKFFKKSWDNVRNDVEDAYNSYNPTKKPGALNSYIEMLDRNPQAYLDIPDEFVVDAIEAQMDKTSRAGEKAHQEIQVDGFYNAIMLQNGGLTDAVYRTETRTVNMIAEDMLTAYDYIRLLAHPEIEIIVYNGDTRYPLSRSVICGDDSEEALWDVLRNNPRIACLLRPGIVSSGNKGKSVYKNTKTSFKDAMDNLRSNKEERFKGRVKASLIDRPMFLATVAMFVPVHNRASRSVRSQHVAMLNKMQQFLIAKAYRLVNNEDVDISKRVDGDTMDIKTILERDLGVTVESLIIAGMEPDAAKLWYQALSTFMVNYINDICEIVNDESMSLSELRSAILSYGNDASPIAGQFDLQSIALAIDCRQTFTGAKTETSTGVEGNITRNHLGTGLYASQTEDRHEVIDGSMSADELAPFIGCLTNFGVFDGTNIEKLEEISSEEPIVVEAPEGYKKQDATLYEGDYQVTTLGRAISVKRGKSAEEDNLKTKRSGDDGTDSISKFTRYSGNSMINIGLVERAYEDAEDIPGHNNKLFQAKLKLAKILQRADMSEGYDDMDLAHYMDLADIMIKEIENPYTDENGFETTGTTIVIRSLGEISAAIRRQLDQDVVNNGSPRDIIDNAVQIADQVGNQSMRVMDAHNLALIALSQIQSSPADPSKRKPSSMAKPSEGTFERNYNTLLKIAGQDGKMVYPLKQRTLELTARKVFESGIEDWYKPKGLGDKFSRKLFFYCPINITRAQGSKKASITKNISPGPQSVWVLEKGASNDKIEEAINMCKKYGMTLAFKDADALGVYRDRYITEATEAPFGKDYMMIPFFNILQSGRSLDTPMAPGSFDIMKNNYSGIFEMDQNFYALADSQMLTDSATAAEINCTASDVYSVRIRDLFYNIFNDTSVVNGIRVCDSVKDIRLASWDEIRRDIIDFVDGGPIFDLGISVVNKNSDDIVKKFGLQIQEYRDSFGSVNPITGALFSSRPDRIVAWMRCDVNGKAVYAPVIPSPTGTGLSFPTKFDIIGSTYNNGDPRDTVDIAWRVSESPDGQIVKVHDGSNPAGKSMTMLVKRFLGKLKNGRRIDHAIAAETNMSRKLASEKRMNTMQTLARIAKLDYGFNFADLPNSFPDNQSIREQLRREYISIDQWESINKQVTRYSSDPEIDWLVRTLVEDALKTGTTNPTDFLACKFLPIDGSGKPQRSFRYVDYDFFFDTSYRFENALLNFYHSMIPELCPPSIDSWGTGFAENGKSYLFKPIDNHDKAFQYGCLQMLQPLPDPDGNGTIWVWNNFYLNLNFYNDEYTALHKPGVNGSHTTMEQQAAMAISGQPLSGKEMKLYAEYTMSPAFKYYGGYEVHLDRGKFISKER